MFRVLIVEADSVARRVVADVLSDEGFSVCTASALRAGQADIDDHRHDLVVLDHLLPGATAEGLVRLCSTASCPVLVLSGKQDLLVVAKQLGAAAMWKPFDLEELVAAVRRLIDTTHLLALA